MTSYYIAGPMRGYDEHNHPAFFECENYLQAFSDDPLAVIHNPAQADLADGFDPVNGDGDQRYLDTVRKDLTDVAASDVIVLLPGWERSEGARRELSVAKWCGLHAAEYDPEEDRGFRLNARTYAALGDQARQADAEEASTSKVDYAALLETTLKAYAPQVERDFQAWTDLHTRGEVRVTNEATGGAKGSKPERYDLLPVDPLAEVARLYGYGASKYADRNWERGYDWHLSYAALQRHANAFWSGETIDPESGCHHLASVVFHAFAMIEWARTHPELDDRPDPS